MARKITRASVPATWHVAEVARVRGATLLPGRVVRVRGDRARYAFVRHVRNTATGAEWLDVRDVATGALRAFHVHRIATVTRKTVDVVPVGGRNAGRAA